MKISTFPAVKPFIKLTRGRIGREEREAGVTFGEGAGGKQVQGEGGGEGVDNVTHRGKGEGG